MWPPTRLIPWFSKTEGNTYGTLLHHPFLFKGKPTQCSRGSKKDFWRRCRGDSCQVKSSQDIPTTHHNPLSPALHYLPFASRFPLPHFTLAVLFALSFPFAFFFPFCPSLFLPLCLKLGKLLSIWTIIISWKILMHLLKNPLSDIQKKF